MTQLQPDRSRGQVLLIAVAAMIVLIGISAVAIDLGFSWMLHRQEQDAADPAALAAARFISDPDPLTQVQTYDATQGWNAACHYALMNGFFDPGNSACTAAGGTAMQVLWPPGPTAGSLAGDHGAVQVIITAQHPSFFGRIFGISTATVSTGAVAARILRARDPVDGVFHQRRHGGIVFGRHDQHAMMGAHHALEIDRVLRHAGFGLQVAVIDRQRVVGERDARDVGAGLRELIGCDRGQLRIMRAGPQRAGDDQDFQCRH